MLKGVQKGQRVVFVEGRMVFLGTVEDVFDNVCRVSCEQTNAYCHIVEFADLFDSVGDAIEECDKLVGEIIKLRQDVKD